MNYQESLMNYFINFFFLFASALALFQTFLYAQDFSNFYYFFLSEAFFYFLTPHSAHGRHG